VSRRDEIRMDDAEIGAFLHEQRTLICATIGRDGSPHVMPLWYVLRDDDVWVWTYAASQKVRNLERDPRATLQVEAGEEYAELRGVMLECDAAIHRDIETVARLGAEIMLRNATPRGEPPLAELPDEARALVDAQATKRVALEFIERHRASWDHRKLGGVY